MESFKRHSPVNLPVAALRTCIRNNWEVVLEYEGEETGPFLVDLSHIGKWEIGRAHV